MIAKANRLTGNPKDQIREASEDDNRALIFEPVTIGNCQHG